MGDKRVGGGGLKRQYLPLKQLNLMQQNVTVFCAADLCSVIKSTRNIPSKKKGGIET